MFRWLTALLLMLPLAAFGLENTNSVTVTQGASTGHDWDQFDIDISGFDDQRFRFTIGDPWPASHTWTFKMARHTITGQVSYVTVADASITDSDPLVSFQLDRTNVPPDGVYLSSLRADDGTLGTDIARGKINVTQSIFDDNDGTFIFPAAVAAVDYFKRSGDILIPTDTEPTGSEGYIYWDDSENTIKAYNGSAWVAVGLAGATAHSGLTGLTTGDDHTQYGKLDEAETVSGNWTFTGNAVNTANPWADNEVADSLTVSEAGIAAAITRDSEWDTFAELQTAVSDKTLVNGEDAATIAGNWVNTANPWADNEVADSLTVTGYMQDGDINTFAELQSWVSDKTLINEEDAITLDQGLTVDGSLDLGTVQTFADGDGTPDVSGGAYFNTHSSVEVITDFDGSGIVDGQVITVFSKGDTTFDTDGGALQAGPEDLKTYTYDVTVWMYNGSEWVLISFMDDTENANPSDSLRLAQRHVDFTGAGTETMITAESKFGFITVDTAKTINLIASSDLVVGMTVTILVTADVVVTIDGNGSNVWMDGTTDSSDPEDIVNSGSAGECISLFWDGTAWRAHHVEGSWTI